MKVIKLFSDAFVVIVIIASIVLLLPNMLKAVGINSFVILSGSMEPLIHTGSVVMIDSREKDIEVGDIILYRMQDTNIVHRVIGVNEDGSLITKGDNNESEDFAPVSLPQVYGKAVKLPWGWCIPYAGYFSNWLQMNRVYLLIAIIGIVVCRIILIYAMEK